MQIKIEDGGFMVPVMNAERQPLDDFGIPAVIKIEELNIAENVVEDNGNIVMNIEEQMAE